MATSQPKPKTSEPVMYWSEDHDTLLCREVLFINPYTAKKGSTQRSLKWEKVAESLNAMASPKFTVDKRSVRDHIGILIKRFKRKNSAEEKSTGIAPDPPKELDNLIQQIMELETEAEAEQQEFDDARNKTAEVDKSKAEDMRLKAMEKLSATKKRDSEESGEVKEKRKRRNGSDTVLYLTQKAEKDHELKEQELQLKKEQLEIEAQRQKEATASNLQFQQQQMAMIQAMQDNQKQIQQQQQQSQQQMMNLQVMMMQQLQEQNKASMALFEKFIKN